MDRKEQTEKLLKDNPQGLSIQEIADKLKVSRQTAIPILTELRGENKINVRKIGQVKLHYYKKR